MTFNYKGLSGIRLTDKEEKLLESIDKYPFELGKYKNLGELKQKLNVNVLLDDQKSPKYYPYQYKITAAERKAIIDDLEKELKRNECEVEELLRRWKNAHLNFDDAAVERIDKEMNACCTAKKELEYTLEKFNTAQDQKNGTFLVKGEANVIILGEYYSNANKVILYYNLISSEELLAVVYVHEIIHAYLRNKGEQCRLIKEIEEPIVESAMLRFFEFFDQGRLLGFATGHVKEKQYSLGIVFYGFGYYIYQNANVIDCLEQYRKIKANCLWSLPDVDNYLDFWRMGVYPLNREPECLEVLYKVLRLKKGGRRHYSINGMGSYSMYEVVEKFAIGQLKLGRPIVDIDNEVKGYTKENNKIILSDNKAKVYRFQYNKNGQVYDHFHSFKFGGSDYFCTKEWAGDSKGNFSKLIDGINSHYTGFQITEI